MPSDDFNRADGPLGAGWRGISGFTVTANACGIGDAAGFARRDEVYPNDQKSEAILVGGGAGTPFDRVGVGVRMDDSGNGYFGLFVPGGSELELWKIVAGVFTQIGGPIGITPVANDNIRVRVEGSTIKVLYNGVVQISVSDPDLISGSPGVRSFASFSGVLRKLDDYLGTGIASFRSPSHRFRRVGPFRGRTGRRMVGPRLRIRRG